MASNNKSKSNLHRLLDAELTGGRKFPRISSGDFRPSEASVVVNTGAGPIIEGHCARAVWYRLKGIPPVGEGALAHQQMRMDVGKQVENSCIEMYKKMGIYVANNVPFRANLMGVPISGEIDAVLLSQPCGITKYLLEDKSLYSYSAQKEVFGKFLFPRDPPGKPKTSHLLQVAIYLYHYSRLSEDDPSYLPFGALHYTDRGDGHLGVFDIELVKEWRVLPEGGSLPVYKIAYWSELMDVPYTIMPYTVEDVLQRFASIMQCLEGDAPPPRDFDRKYSDEKIERYHSAGLMSDSRYDKWKKSHGPRGKGKETIGDWSCIPLYCPWSDLCWGCTPLEGSSSSETVSEIVAPEFVSDEIF